MIERHCNFNRENAMTLIHNSPNKIDKIEKNYGVFEDVFFFSTTSYSISQASQEYEYHVECEAHEIIRARELEEYYETESFISAQKALVRRYEFITEEDAYDLICAYTNSYDYAGEECGSLGWAVQRVQAQLARDYGFRFCESRDEQGTVYAGAMFGRESELVLFED